MSTALKTKALEVLSNERARVVNNENLREQGTHHPPSCAEKNERARDPPPRASSMEKTNRAGSGEEGKQLALVHHVLRCNGASPRNADLTTRKVGGRASLARKKTLWPAQPSGQFAGSGLFFSSSLPLASADSRRPALPHLASYESFYQPAKFSLPGGLLGRGAQEQISGPVLASGAQCTFESL